MNFSFQVKPEVKKEPVKKPKSKMANNKNGGGAKNGKNGQQKSEAAQKRDEARRKMLEEKKRQMKIKQQQQSKNENEVIFVEFWEIVFKHNTILPQFFDRKNAHFFIQYKNSS